MKKLNSNRIGIDSGVTPLFSDFAEGGEMWTGSDARECKVAVEFSEPFLSPPTVHAGFALWDISNEAGTRVDLATETITEHGFTIRFTTWGDTKIARMRVNWMAIGEVEDSELWDV
ncbi:MAG: H-type lectin domain-containing protein [Paracoccaceae bacterium]